MERKVIITLFDREFTFFTDAPEEEVTRVISLVRDELSPSINTGRATLPDSKVLILACLRLAARFVELEKTHNGFRVKQERTLEKLIRKLSAAIETGD